MMTIPAPRRIRTLLSLVCVVLLAVAANAQQLAFVGLRSAAQQGQFNGVQVDAAGNLYLLLDQKDGVRILKTDAAGSALLAQAKIGAIGDVGVALALDPSGNVYVTGTTTSTSLTATAGAAIATRADNSTNTFVAKFDSNLNPLFVTLAGGSRIVPTGIAATADTVFVTGFTYGTNLPVTPSAIQQTPAYSTGQNGFVERFNSSGTTLVYATYLTGANGDTTPAGIAADASDNAYVTGATSASGYPTVAAVVPALPGGVSGFLTKLSPAGDGITFSTFLPGTGMNSIALAANGQSLLLAGNVALGQFPVDTVAVPLAATSYQVLLRMSLDGATVLSSTAVAPGSVSYVAPAADGSAWVAGTLGPPLLPVAPTVSLGQGFAAHVSAAGKVDQAARFGGLPNGNPSFASLPLILSSVAVDLAGEPVVVGAVQPTASASLLATESYDLPLTNATAALPSTLRSAVPATASCSGSLCPGSAAYLAKLAPAGTVPSLALSTDAAPFITVRNLGPAAAANLQVTGPSIVGSNCAATLASGSECNLLLGVAAGILTVSATNAVTQTASIAATTAPASTIVFSPREIDYGIQSAASPQAIRTVTVTNLGTQSQSFISALDSAAKSSPFSQTATDCTLATAANTYTLAPGGVCHITLGLTASSSSASDGTLQAQWLIGTRDVLLTGYSQAAALSVSATHIDFGTQITGGPRLPRYLYLSNSSTSSVVHAAITLPGGSPFALTDGCPATLAPASVCRIQLSYLSPVSTSSDSTTLALDGGLTVLVTGQTLPAKTAGASSVNPNLTVTPASLAFANSVPVTGVSSATQTVTISNTGAAAFALNLALTGDFTQGTGCGATLAGGASCTSVVTFAPSQPGARAGLLAVTAGANTTPAYVALSGIGTAILPANNGTLAFGPQPVGQPGVLWFKVAQPFTSLTATTTGPFTALLVEDIGYGHGLPATTAYTALAAGSCLNCYLGLQFTPTAVGGQTGALSLSSAVGGNPYVIALSGTGTASTGLILSPLAQDFGTVPLHSQSAPSLFQLTNATAAAVSVGAAAISGDFAQSPSTSGGQACSGTLAATATCYLQIAFAPTANGSRTGVLTLTTSGGAVTANLSGTGSVDPGVSLTPNSLSFSNVSGTSATIQTITVGNTSAAPILVGPVTTGTASFSSTTNCGTLASGATCSIQVSFTPSNATVADSLQIPVSGAGTTIYTVPLTGAYTTGNAGLQILPQQMQFGPQVTGAQGLTRQFHVTNLSQRALTLNIALPRQFVLVGPPCAGLAPAATCSFSVAFLPLTNGDIPGTLFAQGTPTDGSATVNGTGYVEGFGLGSGTLAVSSGSLLNFGQVVSGQALTRTITLTNTTAAPLTIRRITSQAPFFATSTCGLTLAPGQACAVSIAYSPINQVATGTLSPPNTTDAGTLVIESDAASSPDLVTLAGSATPVAVTSPSNVAPLATFTVSQSSLTVATTQVGYASAPQVVTLSNTGTRTIHITGAQTTGGFSLQSDCATLVAGASCHLTVASVPQTAGTQIAAVEIASDSVTPLEFISLIGNGAPASLSLTPASLSFGTAAVGATATLPIAIANIGAAPVTFGNVSTTGDYAVSGNCPAAGSNLAVGASCTLQVAFTPTTTGARPGVLSLLSSASALPLTAALGGVGGVAHLLVSSTTLAYGSISFGSSTSLPLTLTNTGTVPLTGIFLTTVGDFNVAIPCGSTTLAAGASCTVQVNFTPTAPGLRTGLLSIASSDGSAPAVLALTGTATSTGGFTLTVDGAASSSAAVASGLPASYQLSLTPTGGFTGTVALTCTPVSPVQYATCSLLPSTLTLTGGAQGSTATINTITEVASSLTRHLATIALCLLAPVLLFGGKRRSRRLFGLLVCAALLSFAGCGGGSSVGNTHLRYTPAGSYTFQVVASSTTGPASTQSVTVTLVVH